MLISASVGGGSSSMGGGGGGGGGGGTKGQKKTKKKLKKLSKAYGSLMEDANPAKCAYLQSDEQAIPIYCPKPTFWDFVNMSIEELMEVRKQL